MKAIGIIPARMKSTRFPGKPLKKIDGLPMIVHVFKRANLCNDIAQVFVATDSVEIFNVVKEHGGNPVMTSEKHKTGTDRIAEVAHNLDCDVVVNIQGDEPLLVPEHISELLKPLREDETLKASTLMCKMNGFGQASECKIVVDLNNNILYFSREDIPSRLRVKHSSLLKLYNIVAFKKEFLLEFSGWELTPLEKIEYIEYLRILEHGYRIRGVLVDANIQSVDTPEELKIAGELMKDDLIRKRYQPI